MQKIVPHLWYDRNAREAIDLYRSLFDDSEIKFETKYHDNTSGESDVFEFKLAGQDFMAINAGPFFKLNAAISLYVSFDSEASINEFWKKLSDGGKVMMELEKYPWSNKYGWVEDRFGLSWQLFLLDADKKVEQKITPLLMYTNKSAGKTEEALKFYTTVFPGSKIEMIVPYAEGEGDTVGFTKHSQFDLFGYKLMAMDSSYPHNFSISEAFSFIVYCKDQAEIDSYYDKLRTDPSIENCGWCKDKYGVCWQILPEKLKEMLRSSDKEAVARVMKTYQAMHKINLEELERSFEGE